MKINIENIDFIIKELNTDISKLAFFSIRLKKVYTLLMNDYMGSDIAYKVLCEKKVIDEAIVKFARYKAMLEKVIYVFETGEKKIISHAEEEIVEKETLCKSKCSTLLESDMEWSIENERN